LVAAQGNGTGSRSGNLGGLVQVRGQLLGEGFWLDCGMWRFGRALIPHVGLEPDNLGLTFEALYVYRMTRTKVAVEVASLAFDRGGRSG